jgi:hypothetical protein
MHMSALVKAVFLADVPSRPDTLERRSADFYGYRVA